MIKPHAINAPMFGIIMPLMNRPIFCTVCLPLLVLTAVSIYPSIFFFLRWIVRIVKFVLPANDVMKDESRVPEEFFIAHGTIDAGSFEVHWYTVIFMHTARYYKGEHPPILSDMVHDKNCRLTKKGPPKAGVRKRRSVF